VDVAAVTPSETKAYGEFARAYRALWERVDPVLVGIQRRPREQADRERVVLDVHITPYARQPLGFVANILPPPDTERVAEVPEDIVSLQVRLPGFLFGDSRQAGLALLGFRDFTGTQRMKRDTFGCLSAVAVCSADGRGGIVSLRLSRRGKRCWSR
jgi:hypothetical protein